MMTKHFLNLAICAALALGAAPAMAQQAAAKFAPIPISSIFRPLQANGTADDALASGRVVQGVYGPAAHASKHWRIAFLFPHTKDPYWSGCAYGVISEAKRLGVAVDILPAAGYDDLHGQLQKIEEAIAAKYDAIVISPISMTATNSAIAKARAAGIQVLELANDSRSDDLNLKVTTSLRSMGAEAMRWAIRDAQQRGLKTINIALLPGPMGAGWVKGEVDGARIAAQEAPIEVNILDIRYGDSERGLQTQLTGRILARHGARLDYILGCTGCAPAALAPIKTAKLDDKIRVVAFDLTSEIAQLIRAKEIYAAADTKGVSQARVAINAAVNLLEGRVKEQPHTILVRVGMLDQQNLANYPFDTSIAPEGYRVQLSYDPSKE
ncbi:TMAO reductase system periplasmic protein TorT [Pseudoduganella sp. FT26W]|uniref:TMAO reductase system periplasmic protein TorT n=1 Tax=Duganella aquatilis TaxID=2666082 RepID=A0A844DC95_9BURK|nr:TMAO reductase system periplasmic protein TorT [Duganella aquatilis]MRW86046.1 TMAO reductase system periplasmic protein TorT [Duganella aquatilis]